MSCWLIILSCWVHVARRARAFLNNALDPAIAITIGAMGIVAREARAVVLIAVAKAGEVAIKVCPVELRAGVPIGVDGAFVIGFPQAQLRFRLRCCEPRLNVAVPAGLQALLGLQIKRTPGLLSVDDAGGRAPGVARG